MLLQRLGAALRFVTDEDVEWSIGRRFAERHCRGMQPSCAEAGERASEGGRATERRAEGWLPARCGADDALRRPWQPAKLPPPHAKRTGDVLGDLGVALRSPTTTRSQCDDGYLFCSRSSWLCSEAEHAASASSWAAAMDAVEARSAFVFCAESYCAGRDCFPGAAAAQRRVASSLQALWRHIGVQQQRRRRRQLQQLQQHAQHAQSPRVRLAEELALEAPAQPLCEALSPSASLLPGESRHVGYCATTEDGPSNCAAGDSGAWSLDELPGRPHAGRGMTSEAHLEACVAKCRACVRCHFVSMSVDHHECSWFHACDVDRLGYAFGGETYVTVRVARALAIAT